MFRSPGFSKRDPNGKSSPPEYGEVHGTRLFPKGQGPTGYAVTGLAARCDWVVMTDCGIDNYQIIGDLKNQPKTVFLSLRSLFHALPCFINNVLPLIHQPFVLITGSEDFTLPNQVDRRWRGSNHEESLKIQQLIQDDRLIHWFIENRDEALPKTSSIPLGHVYGHRPHLEFTQLERVDRTGQRKLNVLCAHRVREGEQWEQRKTVSALAGDVTWPSTTVPTSELPYPEFQEMVRAHRFTLCVSGGGLDPSPKVWTTIANGSIPIIRSTTLDDSYCQLPLVIVNDWNSRCVTSTLLDQWATALSPLYESLSVRRQVLLRLGLDYWWAQILEKLSIPVPQGKSCRKKLIDRNTLPKTLAILGEDLL